MSDMSTRPKQVVVVRRDLRLKRAEAASYVARASSQFLVNNRQEGELSEIVEIPLSSEEKEWLDGDRLVIVLGVPSENALMAIVGRAEILGLTVATMQRQVRPDDKSELDTTVVCAALGPHDEDSIDAVTSKLKLF